METQIIKHTFFEIFFKIVSQIILRSPVALTLRVRRHFQKKKLKIFLLLKLF